jgi:TolB-like protein
LPYTKDGRFRREEDGMLYRFGEHELDPESFALRRDGTVLAVEPKVFDLICFLARNPGRVIGRDEIIEQVWRGRIVSEATISGCIKSARKALGDDGVSQTLIKTVRGRGFQFLGDVTVDKGAPPDSRATAAPATVASPARVAAERPLLAVLPFDNRSADVDAYFADGLTEDIITNLTRFRDLRVIARSTTFQLKEREIDLTALGANYFVEGSVRRAAGRVRITAQLVDSATGVHLWADHYDRDMEDIFAVQDEVTRTIAATLGATLQDVGLRKALKKSPAELDAYDCVLRARRFTALLTEETHAEARDLLEAAIARDPNSADAHALLANVHLAEHRIDANPRPDPIGRALDMARKAVELDPQNAYARCWLAIVHFFRHENDKFEAEAERALSLNPNDPETLADIGHFLAFMGAFERGIALSRKAQKLNPLYPGWYYFSFARYHYDQRDYAAVLADVEKMGMPDFYWTHLLAAAALGQLGHTGASAALNEIYRLKPGFVASTEIRKWNAAERDFAHLMTGLRKAGYSEPTSD